MRIFYLPFLIAAGAVVSFASPITFTYASTGTGAIGGVGFANAAFTITALGDTASILSTGTGFSLIDTTASITIAGEGTFSFTSPTRNFVNNSSTVAGFSFSTGGTSGIDLVDTRANPGLASWAMVTSIGTLSGVGSVQQWFSTSVRTSGGTLTFHNATPTVTFQATTGLSPEPGAPILMMSGLACLSMLKLWSGRRRVIAATKRL